jgi:hypothetical protein
MPVIHSGVRFCSVAPRPPNIMIMYFIAWSFRTGAQSRRSPLVGAVTPVLDVPAEISRPGLPMAGQPGSGGGVREWVGAWVAADGGGGEPGQEVRPADGVLGGLVGR